MQESMWKRTGITWIGRFLLGGIFFYTGFTKIIQPLEFARNIAAYEMLPVFANILIAAILPWMECVCGLLLIIGWKARPAAVMVTGMMVVFLIALCSAMFRGLVIDCGCFEVGVSEAPPPLWIALVRDLGLLLLAVTIWWDACRGRKELVQA